MGDCGPINPEAATSAVFAVLSRHLVAGQVEKIRHILPEPVRKALLYLGLEQ